MAVVTVQSADELSRSTHPRPAGFRVVDITFELTALRDLSIGPDSLALSDDTHRRYLPVDSSGRPIAFSPSELTEGTTITGHAMFQVPPGGNWLFQYSAEGGAPSIGISLIAIAAAPTPTPGPTLVLTGPTANPTPRPAARPAVAVIKPTFFGSSVTIKTYRVRGDTPYDISRSISANGPYSSWLGSNAAGLTKARPRYRFHFEADPYGSCRIVIDAKPPVKISYAIVLPRWKAWSSTAVPTIQWWNGNIREIAGHEKVHVDIYRAAQKKLNSVVTSSTCANLKSRLNKVWNATEQQQCEFDMREYGTAAGLSLKKCLAQ